MSSITAPITVNDPTFTGVSKFATSLQSVLQRAEAIAALPLNTLQAGLTSLNNQQSALQGLDANFSGLQVALGNLQSTVGSGLLTASASDSSVSATVSAGATAGVYSILVNSVGSWSTALSTAGSTPVTDPTTQGISSDTNLTLSVGTATTTITPASSSLQDLVSAINTQAGSQVQATIVNAGSTASPDYRLSLQAVNLGTDAIGLTDSADNNLLSSSTAGDFASYNLGGANSIPSTSRTITLSPGLTVNLVGPSVSGLPATITVGNDTATLANAFSSFVQAYNTAGAGVAAQHQSTTATIQGDSILQSLSGVLSRLGTYSNGTAASALSNFGITVDKTGVLSIDTSKFTAAANANFPTLLATLGTPTSGGFLQTATDLLSSVEAPTTGILTGEESSVASQIKDQQIKIADETATVNQLQTNLTAQISKADAAIAQLENQVSFAQGLFAQYTGYNASNPANASTL
jgi:flagellar hook-associated protein 2